MKWHHKTSSHDFFARHRAWLYSFGFHGAIGLLLCAQGVPSHGVKKSFAAQAVFATSKNQKQPDAHAHVPAAPSVPSPANNKTHAVAKRPTKLQGSERMPPVDIAGGAIGDGAALSVDASEQGERASVVIRATPMLMNKDAIVIPYPEQARQLMIEGKVTMRLTVSEAGHVIDAQVLSGPAFGLRGAALLVARKLFFLPATDEFGHARTASIDHEVVFRLNKQS